MENFIYLIVGMAILFILVIYNNKNNIKKKRNLSPQNFKKSYYKKRGLEK